MILAWKIGPALATGNTIIMKVRFRLLLLVDFVARASLLRERGGRPLTDDEALLLCSPSPLLQPSEMTPLSALKMASLFDQAGFPKGVFNVVNGGPVVGQAIASHMQIRKVAFTGSSLAGRSVMKAAASSNLKDVSLELGGKSPTIVFDDADLDQAVSWSCFGVFFNVRRSSLSFFLFCPS